MQEIINRIITEKLNNGDFEKIVEKHVDKLLDSAVSEAISGWNNPLQKMISEKIQEITINIFSTTDFTKYVEAIKYTINSALTETALPHYTDFVEALQYKLGKKPDETEYGKKITTRDLFDIYKNYIKNTSFSRDNVELDGEGGGFVTAHLVIRDGEYYFYTTGESEWYYEEEYTFKIGYFNRPMCIPQDLISRRWFNNFEIEIIKLSNYHVEIRKTSETEFSECVEVEYE